MNVLYRILGSALFFIIATPLAINYYPETSFISYVPTLIGLGTAAVILLTALSLYNEEDATMRDKNILMTSFIIAVTVPTFFAAASFVHESQTSWSGGEVHWHADYEVFVTVSESEIGEVVSENDVIETESGYLARLDLIDPSEFCEGDYMCALNDRTGIKTFHEHNDQRIHWEGIFAKKEDATLKAFFQTFNGNLTSTELVYPVGPDTTVKRTENQSHTLKVFAKQGEAPNREWKIVEKPGNFVPEPYKRGNNLNDIFIIYDQNSTEEAWADLRNDDRYKGLGLQKGGSGY